MCALEVVIIYYYLNIFKHPFLHTLVSNIPLIYLNITIDFDCANDDYLCQYLLVCLKHLFTPLSVRKHFRII